MNPEEEGITTSTESETPPSIENEGGGGSRYRLQDAQSGQSVEVNPQEAHEGLANGTLIAGRPLRLRHSSGRLFEIQPQDIASSLASGRFSLDTPEDQEARQIRRDLGSAPLVGVTAAEGALRGLDFGTGITEAAERGLGSLLGTDLAGDIEALREANPTAATLGEIGGAALTAIPSGGESLLGRTVMAPGRAIINAGERAGAAVGRRIAGEGAGIGRRLAGRALGGAVEGATQMVLPTISHIATEEALGDDPQDIGDRIIGSLGIGSILGSGAHLIGGLGSEAVRATRAGAESLRDIIARQFQTTTGEALNPGLGSLAEAAVRRGIPLAQVVAGDANGVVPRLFGSEGRAARETLLEGQRRVDQHIQEMGNALSDVARDQHVLDQHIHGPAKIEALAGVLGDFSSPEHFNSQFEQATRLLEEARNVAETANASARAYGTGGQFGSRGGAIAEHLQGAITRAELGIQTANEIYLREEARLREEFAASRGTIAETGATQVGDEALTHLNERLRELQAQRSAAVFGEMDQVRRTLGNITSRTRGTMDAHGSAMLENAFHQVQRELENEQVWGAAATLQAETNEPLHRIINWGGDFDRLLMRPGESAGFDRVLMSDSARVASHLANAGAASNQTAERIVQEHMRATAELADAVIRNRGGTMSQTAINAAERLRNSQSRLQELYGRATSDIGLLRQANELEQRGGLNILNGGIGFALGGPVVGGIAAAANAISNPVRSARILGTIERLARGTDENILNSVRSFLGRAQRNAVEVANRAAQAGNIATNAAYRGSQAYLRRIDELNRHRDPRQLTQDIAENTRDFADAAPRVTAALQQRAARATSYLISQQPKGMNLAGSLIPNPHALPTRQEMDRFLRIARAVDHPETILADLKNHTLTPEGVQALRNVYPHLYNRIIRTVSQELAEDSTNKPSYQDRIQLGVLLGIPTDPSLTPSTMALLQQAHAISGGGNAGQKSQASGRSTNLAEGLISGMDRIESRHSTT